MSSFQFKDQNIDWSSISDEDLNAMYRQSMRSNKTVSEDDEDGNFSHKEYDIRQWKGDQEDNWSKLGMTNVQHIGGSAGGNFRHQRNYVNQAYDAVQSEWQNRLDDRFDSKAGQIAALETQLREMQAAGDGPTDNVPEVDVAEASNVSSSSAAGISNANQALGEAGDFMMGKKAGVKDVLRKGNVKTRGPESILNDSKYEFDPMDSAGGGKSTFDYDQPSMGPDEKSSSFLNDFKLDLAGELKPAGGRSSSVQADKDAQLSHQLAQKPGSRIPNTYALQPGAYQ